MAGVATPFDRFAQSYDETWTNSRVGRLQRDAVWRNLRSTFRPGEHILDLGCGTGEDALWLMGAGIQVTALDASPGMVETARRRGVDARVLRFEQLTHLAGTFDGALSNFGPLNCIESPEELRAILARLVRPGGQAALCIMGRFCLWETVAYLIQGRIRKALRRWSGTAASESLGMRITYPSVRRLERALSPEFVLREVIGIGIAVPPSFVTWVPNRALALLGAIDRAIERLPFFRALSDHRLLIFSRQ
jgi:ubiquinone/menaquinone biosynthesis C-methylase UbiE